MGSYHGGPLARKMWAYSTIQSLSQSYTKQGVYSKAYKKEIRCLF